MDSGRIKCLVWDLDDTLWRGTLLEGDEVVLCPGALETLKELDRRGILHSVASQGDRALATTALERSGALPYLLHPQIGLESDKPEQILTIAERLGLSLEHLALIDDSSFQRAYVEKTLPEVTLLEATRLPELMSMDLFAAGPPTEEATRRRERYLDGERRDEAERSWSGRRSDFLASCEMVVRIRAASPDDVDRVFELIERTNRFNSSAERYTRADVERCVAGNDHDVIVARLVDRFGDLGLVGAVILRRSEARSSIRVLLVSCRVLGRGVGEALLCTALQQAADRGERALDVLFRRTEHNRMMNLLFASHGFRSEDREAEIVHFTRDLEDLPAAPAWLTVLT